MEVLYLPAALGLLANPPKGGKRDTEPKTQRATYGTAELLGMHAQIGTNGVDCFLRSGHDPGESSVPTGPRKRSIGSAPLERQRNSRRVAKTAALAEVRAIGLNLEDHRTLVEHRWIAEPLARGAAL